jgi:hypothetical protein
MKLGSSLRIIIPALLKMEHIQRLALDFPCPAELYEYIRNSGNIKHLLWTKSASKVNSSRRSQCRLESVEFSYVGKKCSIPGVLMVASVSTLKSLSVHSRWCIYDLWAFTQACPLSNLTSFTFSSNTGQYISPHVFRGILESCPSLTALRLPTPIQYPFSLSPDALPKLDTLDTGPNQFLLVFLEGRPVRRLFTGPFPHLFAASERQPLQNCLFSLLHTDIDYHYAEMFFDDMNRTLIYCEDLALDVWVDEWTVDPFLLFSRDLSSDTHSQPSEAVVHNLIMWLIAPSLVDLLLTIRTRGEYSLEVRDMVELRRHFEIRLRHACEFSPNLQQLTVKYRPGTQIEQGFHARRLNEGEWVVRSSLGWCTSESWYHAELAEETEEEYSHIRIPTPPHISLPPLIRTSPSPSPVAVSTYLEEESIRTSVDS